MKHLAAYLLLGLAGNTSPSAEDIKEVLSSVGIESDSDRVSALLKELEGKDINEVCLESISWCCAEQDHSTMKTHSLTLFTVDLPRY